MERKLKRLEQIRIRAQGSSDEWSVAEVVLVSENGESVGLWLDGMVRAGTGFMRAHSRS